MNETTFAVSSKTEDSDCELDSKKCERQPHIKKCQKCLLQKIF